MTEEEVAKLKSLNSEGERLTYIIEHIEEDYFENQKEYKAESDKSWDAMHQALAGCGVEWEAGIYPLNHVVLAGENLYSKSDYIMSLKTPEQVTDINVAIKKITEEEFKDRYFSIKPENYEVDLSEEDFEYTWGWFQVIREFYEKAAKEKRYVLFTADQ